MAIEKKIKVNVETGDSEQELKKLEKGFKKVDDAAGKTNKSVDDVAGNGGAIAILDQLTGGLATRMRDAYEASRLFNISLKATRGALIATGIGAFVVALGLVVAYWDDIVNFITQADEKLQKQIDRHYDIGERLSFEIKLLEAKEKLLIAEGKSTDEIVKQKEKLLNQELTNNELLLERLKTQRAIQLSKALELTALQKIAKFTGAKIFSTIDEDEKKQLEEITKQIQDAELSSAALKLSLLQLNAPDTDTGGGEGKQKREKAVSVGGLDSKGRTGEDFDEQLKRDVERFNKETEILQGEFDFKKSMRDLELQEEKEKLEEEEKLEQQKRRIKHETLNNLISIAGAESNVGKGLLVAKQALLAKELIMEISKTISFSTQAAARSTVAIAEGSAQTAKIGFPQNIPMLIGYAAQAAGIISAITSATSKAGATNGGGIQQQRTPSAPAFNLVSGTGTNQIAETIQNQREPVRAYVVSSEVTSNQSLDRNIKDNSTI